MRVKNRQDPTIFTAWEKRRRHRSVPLNRIACRWSLPESYERFCLLKSRRWLLRLTRVKYQAAITRVARIEKRGRRYTVSTTCYVRSSARDDVTRSTVIEGEHRTYVRTVRLATGRSLARSLDQGRSYCRALTYMSSLSSNAITGCLRSTANTHSIFEDCSFCAQSIER